LNWQIARNRHEAAEFARCGFGFRTKEIAERVLRMSFMNPEGLYVFDVNSVGSKPRVPHLPDDQLFDFLNFLQRFKGL
jgi:hypothetical protein